MSFRFVSMRSIRLAAPLDFVEVEADGGVGRRVVGVEADDVVDACLPDRLGDLLAVELVLRRVVSCGVDVLTEPK